ncbi:hypothetical protein Tco_0658328 [Tanacetum coccineum]
MIIQPPRSWKTLEGPSTPLIPSPVISNPSKEPELNLETSTEKVQNPNLENTAHVPSSGEEDLIFMEIPKPKQNVNPLFEENDEDVKIKSSSSITLTSPEENVSIPPGIDLTLTSQPFKYSNQILEVEENQGKEIQVSSDRTSTFDFFLFSKNFILSTSDTEPTRCIFENVVLNFYQNKKTLPLNVEDVDSFTFIIWTFLPFFTYTKESPLISSFKSENFVFDPGITRSSFNESFYLLSLRTTKFRDRVELATR